MADFSEFSIENFNITFEGELHSKVMLAQYKEGKLRQMGKMGMENIPSFFNASCKVAETATPAEAKTALRYWTRQCAIENGIPHFWAARRYSKGYVITRYETETGEVSFGDTPYWVLRV